MGSCRGGDGFEVLAERLIQNCGHLEMQGEWTGLGLGWGCISAEVENGVPGVSGLSGDSKRDTEQTRSLGQHLCPQGHTGKDSHRKMQC